MFDRVKAKETARELMRRYLGQAVGANMLTTLGSLVPFAAPAASLGNAGFYIDYADQKKPKATTIFRGFDNTIKAVGLFFWIVLWMYLWIVIPASFLFLIGAVVAGVSAFTKPLAFLMNGLPTVSLILWILAALWILLCSIYKRVQYSFAFHVLAAHPEVSVAAALRRSKELTQDCFWSLLVMRLSFIGWAILSAVTSGLVGLFWAIPYFRFTYGVAYRQVDPVMGQERRLNQPDTPQITCLNGAWKGEKFPFNPGEVIVFGRDPASCHILFNEPNSKVSRIHCKVMFDPSTDGYTVMDMNSSNGTFLVDGTQLTPRTPVSLARGTVILLGDSSNSFRLD